MGSSRPWELPCPCASCQKCLLFQSVICALRLPLLDCTCCFPLQLVHSSSSLFPFSARLPCLVSPPWHLRPFLTLPVALVSCGRCRPLCLVLSLRSFSDLLTAHCLGSSLSCSAALPACFLLCRPLAFSARSLLVRRATFPIFHCLVVGLPLAIRLALAARWPSPTVGLLFCIFLLLPGCCLLHPCHAAAAISTHRPPAVSHCCPLRHGLPFWASLLLAPA